MPQAGQCRKDMLHGADLCPSITDGRTSVGREYLRNVGKEYRLLRKIDSLESDALIGGGTLEGHRHLLTGVKTNALNGYGLTNRPLIHTIRLQI